MKALIARFRLRYQIFQKLLKEGNEIEQALPHTALIGIGFNAVWWAAVEHQIDLLIFWHTSSRHGEERDEHPRALVRKLRYLKNIETDEEIDSSDQEAIRGIRLKMAELSDIRHDFTHSFMSIGVPEADWPFTRLRYEGKNIRVEKKAYDLTQLSRLTDEIRQTVSDVSPLVERLALPWLKTNENLLVNSKAEKL